MSYNTYTVQHNETFIPRNYPDAINELKGLKKAISHIAIYFRAEIILSYLRDHSLKVDWINGNPALAQLVTSGALQTSQLEMLFESCIRNKPFLNNLEGYIQMQLLSRSDT